MNEYEKAILQLSEMKSQEENHISQLVTRLYEGLDIIKQYKKSKETLSLEIGDLESNLDVKRNYYSIQRNSIFISLLLFGVCYAYFIMMTKALQYNVNFFVQAITINLSILFSSRAYDLLMHNANHVNNQFTEEGIVRDLEEKRELLKQIEIDLAQKKEELKSLLSDVKEHFLFANQIIAVIQEIEHCLTSEQQRILQEPEQEQALNQSFSSNQSLAEVIRRLRTRENN